MGMGGRKAEGKRKKKSDEKGRAVGRNAANIS